MIWHHVCRRDMEVRSAPALCWLWFGAQEAAALRVEGAVNIDYTYFQMIWGCFLEQMGAGRATTTKGVVLAAHRFPLEITMILCKMCTAPKPQAPDVVEGAQQ